VRYAPARQPGLVGIIIEVAAGNAEEAAVEVIPGDLYRGAKGQHEVLRAKVSCGCWSDDTRTVLSA
jgi:hypothetical protein